MLDLSECLGYEHVGDPYTRVQSNADVYKGSECLTRRQAKVEEQESRFDDPVYCVVHHLFDEQPLSDISNLVNTIRVLS